MTLSGLLKRERVAGTAVPLVDSLLYSRRMCKIRSVARNRAVQYEGTFRAGYPRYRSGRGSRNGLSGLTRCVVRTGVRSVTFILFPTEFWIAIFLILLNFIVMMCNFSSGCRV